MTYNELITDLEKRTELATPAPWYGPSIASGVRHLERNCDFYFEYLPEEYNLPGRQEGDGGMNDGLFIAAARNSLPALLNKFNEVKELLKEITCANSYCIHNDDGCVMFRALLWISSLNEVVE